MTESDAREFRLYDPEADRLMVATPELWRYLPKLLLYPVSGYALYIVIVMGALIWLAGYAGIFGLALAGVLFGWMGYYAMGVVERTATGHATPPPLGTEVLFQGEKLRLALLVLYLATLLLLTLAHLRSGWGVAIFIAGVYLFPAFLASVALQPDLLSTLNPWSTLRFAWLTGLPYLFASLLMAAVAWLVAVLSGQVAGVVGGMLMVYMLLFVCHLIGYVAYHRQDDIGLAVSVQRMTPELQAALDQAERFKELLARIDKHLAAHEPQAARDALMAEEGAALANPRSFHEDLFDALRQRHEDALSLLQGTRLIQLLAREKRYGRALDICERCLDVSKGYLPQPPALTVPLAEEALRDKRLPLFARLDANVQAGRPGSDEAVSLQFLKAQALVQQRQDAAALALLAPLTARAGHPWAPRIAALHRALSGARKNT